MTGVSRPSVHQRGGFRETPLYHPSQSFIQSLNRHVLITCQAPAGTEMHRSSHNPRKPAGGVLVSRSIWG